MDKSTSNGLITVGPRDIAVRLRTEIALSDLPMEEPFPPVHTAWKTCASFRHVNSLAAGRDELWAATWGGVVRWQFHEHGQPVTFTRFVSEHGLPGSHFECIALDAKGHPWVGGTGAGLSTFDGSCWRTFMVEDGLPSDDILCIYNDADGRLWVSTSKGLLYIEPESEPLHWHRQNLDALDLPAEEIHTLVVSKDSALWLGTDWGLYCLYPDGSFRHYATQDGLPCLQMSCLALDGQDHLWIGTPKGLCLLDSDRIVPCQNLIRPIWSLASMLDGKSLWVATPDGIGAYTFGEGFQSVEPHSALPLGAEGRAIAVDSVGRKWFGYDEGITQQFPARILLSGNDLDQMTRGENSLCNCVTAIQVDASGRVWAGTPEGLWYMEHGVWRKCRPGNELQSPMVNVRAIALSPKTKELWVGGWREDGPYCGEGNGLRRFIGTAEVPLVGELPDLAYVDTLTCDVQGNIWVAAAGAVHGFDGRQWKQLPPMPEDALGEVAHALMVDNSDTLWCGTTGGLWRYDGQWHKEDIDESIQSMALNNGSILVGTSVGLKQRFSGIQLHWKDVENLANTNVTAMAVGQAGTVWVGTSSGLIRFAKEGLYRLNVRKGGLASDVIQALALDGDSLWIGTVNGLSRLTPNSI